MGDAMNDEITLIPGATPRLMTMVNAMAEVVSLQHMLRDVKRGTVGMSRNSIEEVQEIDNLLMQLQHINLGLISAMNEEMLRIQARDEAP